jgi:predicted ATPase
MITLIYHGLDVNETTMNSLLVGKRIILPMVRRKYDMMHVAMTIMKHHRSPVILMYPEMGLHPKECINIGDFLIRSKDRDITIVTHSEHILLRILRRVRETTDNECEIPNLRITPAEISVVYVFDTDTSQYKNYERRQGTTYAEIAVLPEGDLNGYWPGGFFDERAEELF